jgi:hypothetical protein
MKTAVSDPCYTVVSHWWKSKLPRRTVWIGLQRSFKPILKSISNTLSSAFSLNEPIQTLGQQQADWQCKNQILQSVKGIGSVTAALCLVELPELGKLSEKQIARLVG